VSFQEKPQLHDGWINGGFFVIEQKFLKYLKNDQTFLERDPFEKLTKKKELVAYKHNGFWQCMDTLRDKEILEKKLKLSSLFKR
jgi:glucose-1-phosphate cytidylyltransferase